MALYVDSVNPSLGSFTTLFVCVLCFFKTNTCFFNDFVFFFYFQVKCICVKVLERKWPELVKKVDEMITNYTPENECAIVTFLELWRRIISIKTSLSVVDTKPFYSNLFSFFVVLNSNVPCVVWERLLILFNEVLCYGSTLALQVSIIIIFLLLAL